MGSDGPSVPVAAGRRRWPPTRRQGVDRRRIPRANRERHRDRPPILWSNEGGTARRPQIALARSSKRTKSHAGSIFNPANQRKLVGPGCHLAPMAAQHFLDFRPLPQGQGSLRPTFCVLVIPQRSSTNSVVAFWPLHPQGRHPASIRTPRQLQEVAAHLAAGRTGHTKSRFGSHTSSLGSDGPGFRPPCRRNPARNGR